MKYQVFYTVNGAMLIEADSKDEAKEKFNLVGEREVYEQCDPGSIEIFGVMECDEIGHVIES